MAPAAYGRIPAHGPPRHAVHRPVGRHADRRARRQVRGVGLRRARARLLGRPLRRRAARSPTTATARERRELLERHGLGCWAISNHLVGQAVCDPIDERHRAILPPEVWGDGDPEGVRQRAAERIKDTARAAARFGVQVVTGFTGSPIWHMLYSFPPNDFAEIERGYERVRRALEPDHRRLRRRGRALRARGPPDRDRLRLRHHAQGAGRDRPPARLRHQLRPEPPRAAVPRLRRVRGRVRRAASTTCTSRTRSSALDGRRSILGAT